MEPTPSIDPGSFAAARAAILLLRAIVPFEGEVVAGKVRLFSRSAILTDEAAASALASVPKPVECRGEVEEGTLTLTHRELSPDALQSHRTLLSNAETYGSFLDVIDPGTIKPSVRLASSDMVRLRGRGGETMLISGADFRRFQREYVLDHTHLAVADPADDAVDQENGVKWTARYAPSWSRTTRTNRLGPNP